MKTVFYVELHPFTASRDVSPLSQESGPFYEHKFAEQALSGALASGKFGRGKIVPKEEEEVVQLCKEALAQLLFDGVPHINAGEMQHRVNLAIYSLRSVLSKVQP